MSFITQEQYKTANYIILKTLSFQSGEDFQSQRENTNDCLKFMLEIKAKPNLIKQHIKINTKPITIGSCTTTYQICHNTWSIILHKNSACCIAQWSLPELSYTLLTNSCFRFSKSNIHVFQTFYFLRWQSCML